MRRIWLIRHAKPQLPPGPRLCYGSTDLPLSPLGRMQGVLLAEFMGTRPVTKVFCSNLSRSLDTARYLDPKPIELPGFRELDCGEWEGLDFDTIKARWPEIYARRGVDPTIPIPGGETLEEGRRRFLRAMDQALAQSEGDIAVVAHATAMRTFFCHVTGKHLGEVWDFFPPYGSVSELHWDGRFHLKAMGTVPRPELTEPLCEKLLEAAGGPLEHSRAVAKEAKRIAGAFPQLNGPLLVRAALLHDIARSQPDHPATGSDWLRELGYPEVADVIRYHHDPSALAIHEQTALFLADKLPLESRFEASRKKCITSEALAAHDRRYAAALRLKEIYNASCGKELIR